MSKCPNVQTLYCVLLDTLCHLITVDSFTGMVDLLHILRYVALILSKVALYIIKGGTYLEISATEFLKRAHTTTFLRNVSNSGLHHAPWHHNGGNARLSAFLSSHQ